jgi:hypothetical protein
MELRSVKLAFRSGPLTITRADFSPRDHYLPLAWVWCSIAGQKEEERLRYDLDKEAFLDRLSDPKVEQILEASLTEIANSLQDAWLKAE